MISVIILTHNDEKHIAATISSITWCDEIIIIDDNSTDQTVLRAKMFDVSIITRSLHNDFAAQRNYALQKAKGDWVLFLDSDEIVSTELHKEIIERIKNKHIVGYYVKRVDHLFGKTLKHGETAHVQLLRLGQKSAGLWQRPVHEIWEMKGDTQTFIQPLDHYPHQTMREFVHDIDVYSTLNAQYLVDKKTKIPAWHIVAYPLGKFIKNYYLSLGFLDGTPGFILATMMSLHSFLTRGKAYLLLHQYEKK